MGGLVQQPAAPGAHRQHPAGRSRGALLRHTGKASHGGVTQTKRPPANPGRFTGNTNQTVTLDKIVVAPVMLNAVFNAANNLTTLSGLSEANGSVDVYEGTKKIGTATADGDGKWSLQANVTGNTVHSYTVKFGGNTGDSGGVSLYTPASNKALTGGPGDDVLIARPNDTLKGMGGSDTFVFNPGFGKVTITDFVSAAKSASVHDIIDLRPLGLTAQQAQQVNIAPSGKNVVITVDQQDTITLVGVVNDLNKAADFLFT